jgi:uncharacterized membrane protein
MDIKTIFGLPAHPLLVHIPIVLLPLVGVGAIAMAVSAEARRRFGEVVLGLAAVAFVFTQLAASSGEALQRDVQRSSALHQHVQMAGTLRVLSFVLLAVVAAQVVLDRYRRRGKPVHRAVPMMTAALAVVVSLGTTGWLIAVGHNGAKAAWQNVNVTGGAGEGLGSGGHP